MKILHVITSLYTGGAERLMVDLLPRLTEDGTNLVELLLFNGIETPFKQFLTQQGIKTHSISMTNDIYNPRKLFAVKRFLSTHTYDVIHTHNTACQLFVPLAVLGVRNTPFLFTTEHSTTNRRRSHWWLQRLDKWIYNRYDAIVCISDKAKDNLEEYTGRKSNIITINNGVDISRFICPVKDVSFQDSFIVTMVAALRVEKDHETLLRAIKLLPQNYRLRIVGGGPHEVAYSVKKRCHELGLDDRVDFMGLRQDIPDILEQSDINVLSSHWEGLSLSSIEGMASGRPFIASDVDGLREVVGDAGVLFSHGNAEELAQKIQFLCEHPDEYRQVATRCQEKARQYDISVSATKYLELYKEVCHSK